MNFLSLFFILTLITGCSSLGEKFAPKSSIDKEKSLIYVYRVSRFMGAAGSPYLCLNGKVVAEAVNGGYFSLQIDPGRHNLSLYSFGKNMGDVDFISRAGNTYYLRYDVTMLNGASESARNTMQSSLPGGGGAIGAVAGSLFESSKGEVGKVVSNVDGRVQKIVLNPGFMFVNPTLATEEIKETKKFTAPKYSRNYCEKKTKK